jgi:hypothetical protein
MYAMPNHQSFNRKGLKGFFIVVILLFLNSYLLCSFYQSKRAHQYLREEVSLSSFTIKENTKCIHEKFLGRQRYHFNTIVAEGLNRAEVDPNQTVLSIGKTDHQICQ